MINTILNKINDFTVGVLRMPIIEQNSLEFNLTNVDQKNRKRFKVVDSENNTLGNILDLGDDSTFLSKDVEINFEEINEICQFMKNGPCPKCGCALHRLEYSVKCLTENCRHEKFV